MTVTRQSLRFKCSVQDCPWPKDEEIHVPWCLGIPDVEHWADKPTHQHLPKKGMGGNNPKSKIVAILCPPCHDRIDNGDWSNDVKDFPGRGRVYFAQDLHGNTLIEKDIDGQVLSDGAEAGERTPDSVITSDSVYIEADSSAPSLSTKEESDGAGRDRTRNHEGVSDGQGDRIAEAADVASSVSGDLRGDGDPEHCPSPLTHEEESDEPKPVDDRSGDRAGGGGNLSANQLTHEQRTREESDGEASSVLYGGDSRDDGRNVADGSSNHPGLTHEQRVAIAPLDDWCRRGMGFVYNGERLEVLTDEWRWQVGEWLNEGEGMMPEEVHGYLRGFRSPMALRQYAWVAGVVTRVTGLSWTHHRAVAALPAPERQEKLEKALTEGLSTRAMMGPGEHRERHSCPSCGADHQVKS
ncbi:hypothetical protein LCGC14_1227190 [marine sediment metagenome]|uniref:Uncharacterized protein n=1 Tax=marine sediment metagenome TaxID=412755 RepID=A0A0F9LWR8_9ZZZZ